LCDYTNIQNQDAKAQVTSFCDIVAPVLEVVVVAEEDA